MSFWFNEWKPWCFLVESRWLSWLSAWWYRWSKKVWDCRSSPSSAGVSHCVFVERRKLPGPTIAQPTQCQAAVAQPAVLQLKYLISIQPTQQRKIFPPQTWTVVEFSSLSQTSSKTARLLLFRVDTQNLVMTREEGGREWGSCDGGVGCDWWRDQTHTFCHQISTDFRNVLW